MNASNIVLPTVSFLIFAKKLVFKNDKEFWKAIKSMHSNVSLPKLNVIDGVTGSVSIVNMWRSHYNNLFNCIKKDNTVHDLYKTFVINQA